MSVTDGRFQCGEDHINYKHGLYKSRLYGIWSNMKTRCHTSTYYLYKHYGARGIIVCDEWKNDFQTFYKWAMENGYGEDLTIDRIDVNGNYEPSNCRWVDRVLQCKNRTSNHYITFNGRTQILKDWADELNIKRQTLERRLKKGWSIDEAFTQPVRSKKVMK